MVGKVFRFCCFVVLSWCKCFFMFGEIWKIFFFRLGIVIIFNGLFVFFLKVRNVEELVILRMRFK